MIKPAKRFRKEHDADRFPVSLYLRLFPLYQEGTAVHRLGGNDRLVHRYGLIPKPGCKLLPRHRLLIEGWARFSGTSAAAPQLAGAAALLLGARPGLTSQQIIEALTETARDVVRGFCNPIFDTEEARRGHDVPTGAGLIDVDHALAYAEAKFT